MNTTTVTDDASGVITRVTVFHHDYFNYSRLIMAILGFMLLAWALRKAFWTRRSN